MTGVAELTVASFNVHWGLGPRAKGFPPFDVPAACATLDADVLVLQESWAPDGEPSLHERVADELGMVVAADGPLARSSIDPRPIVHGRAHSTLGDGDWHLAMLSRLPVLAASAQSLPHLWLDPVDRGVLTVEVAVGETSMKVCGTHLPHLEVGAPLITRALRRALPPSHEPAALIGDMNMWGWCISSMAPKGWSRVGSGKTWPAHRPHSRIDHLLVTDAVEVLWTETMAPLGSDHLAIRGRLRVR